MIQPGSQLPRIGWKSVPDGAPKSITGRGPRIVVLPHSPQCAACRHSIEEFASEAPRFRDWGARLVVVVPGPISAAAPLAAELQGAAEVLADPEGQLSKVGATPGLIVTDEWGEVFLAAAATEQHDLPSLDELGEWVAFIAIQCPECEGPEGGWRSL